MTAEEKQVSYYFLIPVEAALFFVVATFSSFIGIFLALVISFLRYSDVPRIDFLSPSCQKMEGCWTIERGLLILSPTLVSLAAFLATFAVFRCPHCTHRLLALVPAQRHENFKVLSPLGTRATMIFDAYLYRKFSCPKCGNTCRIGNEIESAAI